MYNNSWLHNEGLVPFSIQVRNLESGMVETISLSQADSASLFGQNECQRKTYMREPGRSDHVSSDVLCVVLCGFDNRIIAHTVHT